MKKNKLKIGITLGDPAGIGPEVAINAIGYLSNENIIPVLIGRKEIVKKIFPEAYSGFTIVDSGEDIVEGDFPVLYDVPCSFKIPKQGVGSVDTGAESLSYIDKSIELWESGAIDAITTGPVNKGFIEKCGVSFTGHTEYIAEKIGETTPYMLMFSPEYRVLLVTTHLPLMNVAQSVTLERIEEVITAGHLAMSSIDDGKVKIAITGLDPHCGDNGAIGTFDRDVTSKAIENCKAREIDVEGPFAADTIFMADKWKKYNLVIAHYHDQGLIPFKQIAFDKGVNVTLGLSVIRTSVDHGTAYDIAGQGVASYNSMLEAIELAYKLELSRR